MPDWALWLIAAAALGAGEMATLGFFLGPVAIAAAVAAGAAAIGAGVGLQIIVFIAGSLASLLLVRPVARRHLHAPAALRTGTAALVGQRATVVQRVDTNGGSVKIGGEEWSAVAFDDDRSFEPGERAEVIDIKGATALID